MATTDQAIQQWYTQRLRDYMLARYRASLAFNQGQGGDPEVACPTNTELNSSGERADPSVTPMPVQEAYAYYKKHIQDEDMGACRFMPSRLLARRPTRFGSDGWRRRIP